MRNEIIEGITVNVADVVSRGYAPLTKALDVHRESDINANAIDVSPDQRDNEAATGSSPDRAGSGKQERQEYVCEEEPKNYEEGELQNESEGSPTSLSLVWDTQCFSTCSRSDTGNQRGRVGRYRKVFST